MMGTHSLQFMRKNDAGVYNSAFPFGTVSVQAVKTCIEEVCNLKKEN